mmetsp:Transcript_9214/g.22659  ORF Transcript_9214/g.22659 Transcript_9214/m.22659 type:complete len:329 (+) Transcript_9214:243-1229(+)
MIAPTLEATSFPPEKTVAPLMTVAAGRPCCSRALLRDVASSFPARLSAAAASAAATRKAISTLVARSARLAARRESTSLIAVISTLLEATPAADATPVRKLVCLLGVNSKAVNGRETTISTYVVKSALTAEGAELVGAGVVVGLTAAVVMSATAARAVVDGVGRAVVVSAVVSPVVFLVVLPVVLVSWTTVKDVRCVVRHTTPLASALAMVVTPASENAEPLTYTHLLSPPAALCAAVKGIEMLMGWEREATETLTPFCDTRSVTRGPTGATPPKAGTAKNAPISTSTAWVASRFTSFSNVVGMAYDTVVWATWSAVASEAAAHARPA